MSWALRRLQEIVADQDEGEFRSFIGQLLPESRLSQIGDDCLSREAAAEDAMSVGVAH
jgi:hypothetical protein